MRIFTHTPYVHYTQISKKAEAALSMDVKRPKFPELPEYSFLVTSSVTTLNFFKYSHSSASSGARSSNCLVLCTYHKLGTLLITLLPLTHFFNEDVGSFYMVNDDDKT